MMGDPDRGQDENERYGWEVMFGDVGKSQHAGTIPALLDAIDIAREHKVPLHLTEHFLEALGGPYYAILTKKEWDAANLDNMDELDW